ncbi:MAG: hypothetical protein GY760_03035 [Deltaproteobacteria bacterium]|nr:hypothetical protein [Deltaproteobacteria bacterium]
MSKEKIFYNPIDGSAPLSIYWFDGAKGDAIEANIGDGVGFFSPSQDMLGVIFDDVLIDDEQELFFLNGGKVKIKTSSGKVEIVELVKPQRQDSA